MNYENMNDVECGQFLPKGVAYLDTKVLYAALCGIKQIAREAYRAGIALSAYNTGEAIKPASKTIAVLSTAHQNDILEKACKSTAFSISDFERIADGLNGVIRGAINIAYAQGMNSTPRAEEPDPDRVMNFTVNPLRNFQGSTPNYSIGIHNASDYELRIRVIEVGPQKCDPLDSEEFENLIANIATPGIENEIPALKQFIRERFTPK